MKQSKTSISVSKILVILLLLFIAVMLAIIAINTGKYNRKSKSILEKEHTYIGNDNKEYKFITDPFDAYSNSRVKSDISNLCKIYDDILTSKTIGKSEQGNDIYLLQIGHGPKNVLYTGSIHAREYMTTAYLLRFSEHILYCYTNGIQYGNYNITSLLEKYTIYVLPMANPDGVNISLSKDAKWKANANKVDINRNFPNSWDLAKDTGPDYKNYKGSSAASESETRVLIELCQNTDFEFLLSFHTKGEIIYWEDNVSNTVPGAEDLVKKLSHVSGYLMAKKTTSAESVNGFENWFRSTYNKPGLCVELTPYNNSEIPHENSDFNELVWNKAKYLGVAGLE